MDRACSTYRRGEKYEELISEKKVKERDHLEDLGKDDKLL
jgi:hypothetical protein